MNNINLSNLKSELNRLSNLIDDYEDSYLDYYNQISSFSFIWNDNYSKKFFNNIKMEKLKVKTTLNEIQSIYDIYKYMYDKYICIGNKISFDINNKARFIDKINDYIDYINSIIYSYNSLDLSFCTSSIRNNILNEKEKMKKVRDRMLESKERIVSLLNKIDSIEKSIRLKLSKIDIELVKITDIRNMYRV